MLEKDLLRWHIYKLVHKFIPMLQAMKILDANAAVPRNEKGRGDSSMEFENLWKPKRKIDHFAALGAHVTSNLRSWDWNYWSTKTESRSVVDILLGPYAFFCYRKLVCVPDDHLKKSWMLSQDYQVVVNEQLMQWPPTLMHNGRTLPDCSIFPNQNVQMFRYVLHDTNGRNHEQTLKIPWYTCWTTFVRSSITKIAVGKTIPRSFTRTWMGRKFRNGNVCSFIEKKSYFCQYMWMTSEWLERSRMWLLCGGNWWECGKPPSFFDHVYLWCTQRECKPNETIIEQCTKICESPRSAGRTEHYEDGRNLKHKL